MWWVLTKNGMRAGPFTVKEIQGKLRSGELDPFDIVLNEKTQVQTEIFAIDEIFSDYLKKVELKHLSALSTKVKDLEAERWQKKEAAATDSTKILRSDEKTQVVARQDSTQIQTVQYVLEERTKVVEKPSDADKVDKTKIYSKPEPAKFRYYLIDSFGDKNGPFEKKTIVKMYYAGKLDEQYRVVQDGSLKSLSISQFLAWIEQKKAPKPKEEKAQKKEMVAERRQEKLKVSKERRERRTNTKDSFRQASQQRSVAKMQIPSFLRSYFILPAILVLGGVFFIDKQFLREFYHSATYNKDSLEPSSGQIKDSLAEEKETSLENKVTTDLLDQRLIGKGAVSENLPVAQGVRSEEIDRHQILRKKENYLQDLSNITAQLNKIIILGPLGFDRGALSKCRDKCSVPLFDQRQRVITAKFFKDAFAQKLAESTHGAYVEGRISSDGREIYLIRVH